MRLSNVKVRGFRRFENEQNLQISTKLTAIVGPNEAGKTSLLKAISYFADDGAIDPSDVTILSDQKTRLVLTFFLDAADLEAAGIEGSRWLDVVKEADGDRRYDLRPRPLRDLRRRRKASKLLAQSSRKKDFRGAEIDGEAMDMEKVSVLCAQLATQEGPFSEDDFGNLQEVIDFLSGAAEAYENESWEKLGAELFDLLEFEKEHDPFQQGINRLAKRLPRILNFTSEYRNMELPYNIANFEHEEPDKRRDPSRPLAEIIRLSALPLGKLKSAALNNSTQVVSGLLDAANYKLAEVSKNIWNQSDAILYLRIDGTRLTVLVKNTKDFDIEYQYSKYESRSDGYKQFIALQIFAFLNKSDDTLLIIDEVEHHLHYDAQADLIQLLQAEKSIGSVVYTTHSAGALPEDLGVGIRLVEWDSADKKNSRIENKFWARDSSGGFKPLLFGMGATTLAFFPMRKAIIGEGPTELLLLPKILKEASGLSSLDFQVVHGLSNINPKGIPMLDEISKGVCYIVDADDGASDIVKALRHAGVESDKIFSVRDIYPKAVTLEDLLDGAIWLEGVNTYIAQFGPQMGVTNPIKSAPDFGRIRALPKSIQKEKISFSYNVLQILEGDPEKSILRRSFRKRAAALVSKVRQELSLDGGVESGLSQVQN